MSAEHWWWCCRVPWMPTAVPLRRARTEVTCSADLAAGSRWQHAAATVVCTRLRVCLRLAWRVAWHPIENEIRTRLTVQCTVPSWYRL